MAKFENPENNLDKKAEEVSSVDFARSIIEYTKDKIYFIDPISKEKMSEHEPPMFLKQSEGLGKGFNFLKENNDKIEIEIIFSNHDSDKSEGLGDASFNFDGRVGELDIFLLEGIGWDQELRQALNALAVGDEGRLNIERLKRYVSGNLFRMREIEAINGCGAGVSFFDVENKPVDNFIEKQILGGVELTKQIGGSRVVDDGLEIMGDEAQQAKNLALNIQVVSLEAIREWYMVMNTGSQVLELCRNNKDVLDKLRKSKIKVLMVVGKTHLDLVRKFAVCGIGAASSFPNEDKEDNPINQKMPEWLARGYINTREIRELSY